MDDQPLTRAQRQVARLAADALVDDGFCLAGGAALVASGLSTRPTRDLDMFTGHDVDMPSVAARVAEALEAAGYEVATDRAFPTFVALRVTAGRRGQVLLDLGRDHIEWPPVTTALGPTLSPRELAANKVLALFGRVQPRDLADVATLAGQLDLGQMLADAKVKDPGFDRRILAEMIRMVVARPDAEWPVGADVEELRRFGRSLADDLERGWSHLSPGPRPG
jgi:nucleotidyltransferase AbiEii toxin of type IV toxin-antitoxin system